MKTSALSAHSNQRQRGGVPPADAAHGRYAQLFENLPVAVYRTTPTGELVDANPACVALFGYPSLEALQATPRDANYADPEDRRRFLAQLARDGRVVDFRCRIVRRDGREVWVREDAVAVRDDHGRLQYIEGTMYDISERTATEQELRRSRDQVASIIANSNVAIVAVEADGRLSYMKGRAYDAAGLEIGNFLGKHIADITRDRPDLFEHWQRAFGGEAHTAVMPILTEMHQVSFVPVYDAAGQIERVLMVGVDVTERIQSEQQLSEMAKYQQQMSEYLTLLLESTGDGVYSVDAKGRCTFINRAGASMLGYTPAEVVGSKVERLMQLADRSHGAEARRQLQKVGDVMRTGKPYRVECTLTRSDGTSFDAEVAAYPLADGEKSTVGAVVVFRDMSERKAADDARRENEAKSRFLATMSHELRTPLNSILGFSQLLADQRVGRLTERQQRYIANIQTSGRHLLALINDVLDLSKVEAGRMAINLEEVEVPTIIEDALAKVRPLAEDKQLRLRAERSAPLHVLVDRRRLEQVLLNLLSNAIKFTLPGGTVTTCASAEGDRVVISVTDTGIGIAEDQLETIFEEFTQLDSSRARDHEGTGLGLALSRRLVRLMFGDIRVTSEVGRGSTFDVILPLAGRTGKPKS